MRLEDKHRRPAMERAVISVVLGAAACMLAAAGLDEIEKFFRPAEGVATAAQPTTTQLAAVRDQGFRTIVNLRDPGEYDSAAEERSAVALGFRYVSIPVRTSEPKPEEVDAFLKVLADPEIYPVLIHCGSGNRVGAFWFIRRVLVDGWNADDAEKEARQIGMKSPSLKVFALEYLRSHAPAAR